MSKTLPKHYKEWDKENNQSNPFWFSLPEAKKQKMYQKLTNKSLEDNIPDVLRNVLFND